MDTRLEWSTDNHFTVDGVGYRLMEPSDEPDRLIILKPKEIVERYERLVAEEQPRRIFEVGIYNGGSTALLAQLAEPEKLVAVDIRPQRVELERFIDERGLRGSVSTYAQVDQADAARLREIVAKEFDGPLDLVVDDASHLVEETRCTFDALFPHVRPGGMYLIEDWSWPHQVYTPGPDMPSGVRPLSAFAFELALVAGVMPDLIDEVCLRFGWALVRRGPAVLEQFNVSACLDELGRQMVTALGAIQTR